MCVRFALVCCALRVDFIKSLRLTNTVIIIIIIICVPGKTVPDKSEVNSCLFVFLKYQLLLAVIYFALIFLIHTSNIWICH